ncbi:MAG TPA: CBS domain-containing protein [Nitrososphaeraceae archaeon]|nr:CBS domain-containing protein [Nitrososphaeraceae archaeon]
MNKGNELTVREYMTSNPITVQSDLTVTNAAAIMANNGIGNLIVIENRKPVGILSEREILRYLSSWMKIPNNILEFVKLQSFCKVSRNTSILDAAKIMISTKSRLLVYDDYDDDHKDIHDDSNNKNNNDNSRLIGIITASDIVRAFRNTNINPPLEDVMTRKIFDMDYNSSILTAVTIMHSKRIGSIIVNDTGNKTTPYGIFTERELLAKILFKDIGLSEKVGDYCSTPLIMAEHGIRANEAANIMYLNKIKRLPLTNPLSQHKEIISMVTARDLVEAFQKNNNR